MVEQKVQKYVVTAKFAVFAKSEQHAKDLVAQDVQTIGKSCSCYDSFEIGGPEILEYDKDTQIMDAKEMKLDEKTGEWKLDSK